MLVPKLSWPAVLLALVGAGAMLLAGAGVALTGAILLLWLGTLWLSRPAPASAPRAHGGVQLASAPIESMLEPLDIPLMLTDRGRIAIANAAAREQLGAHIVGQDVRVALRHPDAVALLDREGSATIPALTGTRSIWQVSRRRIDERFAMIELVNKTAEADKI